MKVPNKQREKLFAVALPTPINRLFTYTYKETITEGQRVEVPFGRSNRRTIGVVIKSVDEFEGDFDKIKPILQVLDEKPIYSEILLDLGRWLANYYMHPLGEVMRTMLPSGGRTLKKLTYLLTEKGEQYIKSRRDDESVVLGAIFQRKNSLTQTTLNKKLDSLISSVSDKHVYNQLKRDDILSAWKKKGWLEESEKTQIKAKTNASDLAWSGKKQTLDDSPKILSAAQQQVYGAMVDLTRKGDTKPTLLRGVTGSGKTELYLQLIQVHLDRDKNSQVLVMVPEISLTPQMTRIFEARFSGRVVVVHSALTDKERWARMEAIRHQRARILIGPRSAVFAPFQRLAFIVVDEEHDGSYKQVTGLCYHGRDVAIMRAKLEKIPILLGSATPSLESFYNAQQGKYHYFELSERAHPDAQLPKVEIVSHDLKKQFGFRLPQNEEHVKANLPVHPKIIEALNGKLHQNQQSIVILNRRGFAYYLYSLDKQEPVTCPHCSVSLTVHRKSWVLRCHYCDYRQSILELKALRPHEVFLTVGYGSEQAEDFLKKQLPSARIARMDSDTTGDKDSMQEVLEAFRLGQIDLLVGTQMLAKGHDFARVTLICLLETDQILNLPDFRAGERAFQLIVQAAGRAGRDALRGHVMIQTQKPDHPIIAAAIEQDFAAFTKTELALRKAQFYPPFSRMISFEWNAPNPHLVDQVSQKLHASIVNYLRRQDVLRQNLIVLGPASPPIETVRGRHRRILILMSTEVKILRTGARMVWAELEKLKSPLRAKVDVDPQSIL